jgi:hypothetical protein
MRLTALCGVVLSAGFTGLLPAPAAGQSPTYPPPPVTGAEPAPPASPEATQIAACLCLHNDLERFTSDMAARRRDSDQLHAELDRIDAELQRERATLDVASAAAVEQFRQRLAERDALFRRSTGPAAASLTAATTRYNAAAGQYNDQCANRPRDPMLLAQVQETLRCPLP